jgi:O-antigen/teichoic acid export membrane protein
MIDNGPGILKLRGGIESGAMPSQDLARKSLLLLGSTWGGAALGMLVSILVGRTLGPAALGSLGFSTGVVGLVMAALLPGFAQAHLKRLAEGQDAGRCVGTMLSIQLALHAVLVAALAVVWTVQGVFTRSDLALVFLALLGAQVATNFADIFLKVMIAREWVVPHAMILLSARLLRLLATFAVLAAAPGLVAVAATFLVEPVVSGVGGALFLARRHHVTPRAPTRASLGAYWSYARPFLVSTPLALFQDSIDRVLVGAWAGLTAAGHYQIARALWEALSSVIAAPATFLFTRLSALYARRSEAGDREAREFFFHALDKLLFLTVPIAFAFWAFAEPGIVLLYGPAFRPAALPLRILVLAAVVANVVNPYTLIVMALDQAARFVPVNLLRVVAYALVLVALVPPQPLIDGVAGLWPGAPGAAAARLFLMLFPCWIYVRWTRELAGVSLSPHVGTYVAGFALLLVLFHALQAGGAAMGAEGWAVSLPAAGVAGCVYVGYLFARHPGTGDNLRYAQALLSPIAFIRFLRGGLRGPARP